MVGPFQGKPACVRIALARAYAAPRRRAATTVVVPNVHEFAGHIACDAASNSEIVVPLVRGSELIGVLDVDSPKLARFDAGGSGGLEQLAAKHFRGEPRSAAEIGPLTALAREMYAPVRVSTRMTSPSLMNSGTRTTAPVSSFAGF